MARELLPHQIVERSLMKTYRKTIWHPFVLACREYDLLAPGDRIAVCVSGGKDSFLLAKLMQELERHTDVPFETVFLCMDPGYKPENRCRIEENAALLRLPLTIFETNVFSVAESESPKNPCYLCAKMRRGCLYKKAQELGCNKIALGHHFDDVIETTLMSLFYSSEMRTMIPKLHSLNYPGMELIRPLYRVREHDIQNWAAYNRLEFLQCACSFTEGIARCEDEMTSKRQEVKALIRTLKETTPDIDRSIFNAAHNVCLDTMPGFNFRGEDHTFLDYYHDPEAELSPDERNVST